MRTNIGNFVLLFLVFLALQSCQKSYNPNQQTLLYKDFHQMEMPMDSLQTLGAVLDYVEQKLCVEGNKTWPVVFVNFKRMDFTSKKVGNHILKMGIEPTPCPDLTPMYDFSMILEIVKDRNNLKIEDENTELDSIPSYVHKQYFNYGQDPKYSKSPVYNGIWICAARNDKMKDLVPIIMKVVDGYLQAADEYSMLKYKRKIKDLNADELLELRKEFPFSIAFKYTDDLQPKLNLG